MKKSGYMANKYVLPIGLAIVVYLGSLPTVRSQVKLADDPAYTVERILLNGGSSGGIEITGDCGDTVKAPLTIAGATIEEKLISMQASMPTLRWEKTSLGYRVKIGTTDVESVTNVVIPPTTVSIDIDNIQVATGELLNKPEIENHIARTKLKLFGPTIGFSSVRTTNAPKQSELKLPRGSMADDLDQIGAASGQRVWLYASNQCDGTLSGRLSWLP